MSRITTPDEAEYINHKVEFVLPDGSTTIWLNEYVDALVQAKVEEIIELVEGYIPIYYGLSPNDDAVKYPIEGVINLIKQNN